MFNLSPPSRSRLPIVEWCEVGWLVAVVAVGAVPGCASSSAHVTPLVRPANEAVVVSEMSDGREVRDGEPVVLPDKEDVKRAHRLTNRGLSAYRNGSYDLASELLTEALSTYPFLPRANLVLGKIYLMRGAATGDEELIRQARRMFKMAKSLDPSLEETDELLRLFTDSSPSEGAARAQ